MDLAIFGCLDVAVIVYTGQAYPAAAPALQLALSSSRPCLVPLHKLCKRKKKITSNVSTHAYSGGTKILILGSPNSYMCIISYVLYKSLLNY